MFPLPGEIGEERAGVWTQRLWEEFTIQDPWRGRVTLTYTYTPKHVCGSYYDSLKRPNSVRPVERMYSHAYESTSGRQVTYGVDIFVKKNYLLLNKHHVQQYSFNLKKVVSKK